MEPLLLAAATCADIFAAAFGLGASGIKLPARSAGAVAFAGAALLWLSVLISSAADRVLSLGSAVYISKATLFVMGIYTLLGDMIKRRKEKKPCRYSYADVVERPDISDSDNSQSISYSEAVTLGIALSLDSVISGIGAGIGGIKASPVFFWALFLGFAAAFSGSYLGKRLSGKIKLRPSIPCGLILIILAAVL